MRVPQTPDPERQRLLELLRIVQALGTLAGPYGKLLAAVIAAALAALAGYSAAP